MQLTDATAWKNGDTVVPACQSTCVSSFWNDRHWHLNLIFAQIRHSKHSLPPFFFNGRTKQIKKCQPCSFFFRANHWFVKLQTEESWIWLEFGIQKNVNNSKNKNKIRLLEQCKNNVPMESSKKEQEQQMSHDWSSVQLEEHPFVKCGKWHQKKHWGNKTSWKNRSMLKNTRKRMWGKVKSEEETKSLSVTENATQKKVTTKKNLAKPRVNSGIKCACNPWIQFLWRQVVHHPSCLMGKGGLICLPCGSYHNRVCFIVRSKWSGNRSNEEHSKGQTS